MSFTILKKSMITALIIYHHSASSSSSSWSSGDPGEINQPLPLAASGRMLRTPPSPSPSQSLELLCFKLLPPKLPKLRTSHQSAGASEGKGVGFRVDIPHKNKGCRSISFT